jgi:hypothetical protein
MNASRAARASRLRCFALALSLTSVAVPLAAQTEPPPCPEPRELGATPSGAADVEHAPALVLLLDLGQALSRALVTALAPWGLRVVESAATNPGPSMPSSALVAQRIAQRCGARAVVWLARDTDGFALWVYDAQNDRSLARPAPAPPLDASGAAALALSVKTVLRLVGLAPEPASPPEAAGPAERGNPSARPKPVATAPPDSPAPRDVAPAAAQPAAAWRVGASAGVRFGPFGAWPPEARYGALVRWSPEAVSAGGTRAWVGLTLEAGAAQSVRSARLEGHVWDPASELALGVTQVFLPWLTLGLSGAAALHVSVLSGVAREFGVAVEDTRFNPTLRAQAELQLQLGRAVLVLQPGAELWLRAQRYLLQALPALERGRASVQLSLSLQLPLD